MDADFWRQRWASNQIGFHEADTHAQLRAHWPSLGLADGVRVFVPLCGKSLDMLWLRERGHEVLGVELSDIAVRAFFEERGLAPTMSSAGDLRRYSAAGYTLWCGDLFALTAQMLGPFAAVYDRAALIALPPALRHDYAVALTRLCAAGTRMLIITVEYDPGVVTPPPFAVHAEELATRYGDAWSIEDRGRVDAQVKGEAAREGVFALARRGAS